MFVCRFNSDFGVGHNPLEAFEDMIDNIEDVNGPNAAEGIEPPDCEFYESIQVDICADVRIMWNIEPDY